MHCLYATPASGNCFKPQLLMALRGIPCTTIWVDVLRGENRQLEYLSVNPMGTVPFLILPDRRKISESNAMLWHLAEGSDWMPKGRDEEIRTLEWMLFEQTRLEPFLAPARVYLTLLPHMAEKKAAEIESWQAKALTGLSHLNRYLEGRDYLAADRPTIADIAIYGYVHLAGDAGFGMARFEATRAWLDRVRQIQGYRDLTTFAEAA